MQQNNSSCFQQSALPACSVFTSGYCSWHSLRTSDTTHALLLPSQLMSSWLKSSLRQRRLLAFLLVAEIFLHYFVLVARSRIEPITTSLISLLSRPCCPQFHTGVCTIKECFNVKHTSSSSSLSILPKESVPSHSRVPAVHAIPPYLHDCHHVPYLPHNTPTSAAIPLSLLGLSPLPMMKLISHPCHQASSLIAKTTFLPSPQTWMSENLEELQVEVAKLPNVVWKLLLKNPFGYHGTARGLM